MLTSNIQHLRHTLRIPLGIVGVLLSVVAFGMLAAHARSFSLKRDTAVMIGTTLPDLRATVALLAANRQAEQFFAKNALAAREEQASVYILPAGPAAARTVDVLQTIATVLKQALGEDGALQDLTFENETKNRGEFKTIGAQIVLRGSFRFAATFLSVLSFSGDMMIRDALSDEATTAFLKKINASAPLSLKAAEDFLYADLLNYAAEPDRIEQEMLQDLPLNAQAEIRSFVLQSGLASVRSALSEIAPAFKKERVWPLPFVTVDALKRNGDTWTVQLTFYRR